VAESKGVVPRATGTDVIVTKIFDKTPVRRKVFKKEIKTHVAAVKELFVTYALARPDVRFVFKSKDPADQLQKAPGLDLKGAARAVFRPRNILDNMVYGEENVGGVGVRGFFPKDGKAMLNKPLRYYVFVNQRPVTLKPIRQHVRELCCAALDRPVSSNHPWLILHITVPSGEYDVNTDKSKTELLLSRDAEVSAKQALGDILSRIFPTDGGADQSSTAPSRGVTPPDSTAVRAPCVATAESLTPPHPTTSSRQTASATLFTTIQATTASILATGPSAAPPRIPNQGNCATVPHAKTPRQPEASSTGAVAEGQQPQSPQRVPTRERGRDAFTTRRLAELASLSPTSAHKWAPLAGVRTSHRTRTTEGAALPSVARSGKRRRLEPEMGPVQVPKGQSADTAADAIDLSAWSRGAIPSVCNGAAVLAPSATLSVKPARSTTRPAVRTDYVEMLSDDEEASTRPPPRPPKVSWAQSVDMADIGSRAAAHGFAPCSEVASESRQLVGCCSLVEGERSEWVVFDAHGLALLNVYRLHELVTYVLRPPPFPLPSMYTAATRH
jgi:hypothetical protein